MNPYRSTPLVKRGVHSLFLSIVVIVNIFVNASSASSPTCSPSISSSSPPTPFLASNNESQKIKVDATTNDKEYELLKEEVIFHRWRSILSRVVRMPNGNVVDYDVVDQKGVGAVVIFVWDTQTKTATLVREYNPGCHRILYGVAAGIIEDDAKHSRGDPKHAAIMELEEECHLSGGTWYCLTTPSNGDDSSSETPTGVSMDKYAITKIIPYLVIDAAHVHNPKPCDDEEDIEIIRGVSIDEILQLIRNGEMNLVGGWSCLLAIEKLRELGEI